MPKPTLEILQNVCEYFSLGNLRCFENAGGCANKNSELETDKGRYFVKFVLKHSLDALRSEIEYVERISSTGFPCPVPIKCEDGDNVFNYEENSIVVLPYIQGKAHDTATPERISQLGCAMAELHLVDTSSLQPRTTWWHPDYLATSFAQAKERFDNESLDELERKIASFTTFDSNTLPASIVHGDPWPGNALFDGEQLVALVDWEETTIGYSIFDLAYLAIHGALVNGSFKPELFDALINAYESVRKLSSAERYYFDQVAQRIAFTNYLWLLLKSRDEITNPEHLWCTQWYWSLELEKLKLH